MHIRQPLCGLDNEAHKIVTVVNQSHAAVLIYNDLAGNLERKHRGSEQIAHVACIDAERSHHLAGYGHGSLIAGLTHVDGEKSDLRAVKVLECEAVPKSKKLLKFVLDDGTAEKRVILSGIHEFYEPEQLVGKTCIAITNLPPRKMMGIDSCGMLISALHKEGEEERLHLLMVDPAIPAGAKLY